jgi:hypothetical protein
MSIKYPYFAYLVVVTTENEIGSAQAAFEKQ